MSVKYRPVAHDGEHTMEQQMFLLAQAAHKAWSIWAGTSDKPSGVLGVNEDFDRAMRNVYAQTYQTDVFMGGVHHAARAKP